MIVEVGGEWVDVEGLEEWEIMEEWKRRKEEVWFVL